MQSILRIFLDVFQRFSKLLKGEDSWYLVIDEALVAQEASDNRAKKTAAFHLQIQRKDHFNRIYESNRRFSSSRLSLGEIWATLSPFSIFKFLRYSLSDVI